MSGVGAPSWVSAGALLPSTLAEKRPEASSMTRFTQYQVCAVGFTLAEPYDSFTAADTQFGTALHWGLNIAKLMPHKPVFTKYLQRLMQRPAFQRFMEKETKAGG